ncbi:flagellar biosynthesis protein FlhG [Keratinibaculum paraultunense]|uniref:Flagellar biosynthesis protein FlhG n=1 Tax=Keratinibaculum paraultunense TaxID=1278232 RepID=A0A4R3KVY6_9FIRM|nr:MinD/ParA family protein [Keratinibaculum paraultunense]QQY80718.1 MinD/ParA family protein [Keratinibaculum paraultunense]TCS89677.1 flagellar biosynthesis protein FlhG [Keratinibaculum paraultunense]
MKDQAEKLRNIMKNKPNKNNIKLSQDRAQVLAITSGKGGVGKTSFSVNLAISLKRLGYKVLILDADIGLANIEILTGINMKYTIEDLIKSDKNIYDIIEEGPEGIKLISGGSGIHQLSMMDDKNINKLLEEMENLEREMDYIIIDTGAGISNIVLDFVMISDETILITTSDPTSLMDAYTMIKALTTNGYKGKINIVINIVENRREAENIFNKLSKVSQNFLNVNLNYLGYLQRDVLVNKAVKIQQPFLILNPSSNISKKINVMALKLINPVKYNEKKENLGFVQRLKALLFGRDR